MHHPRYQPRNHDAIARRLPPVNPDRTTRTTTPPRYPGRMRTPRILSTAVCPSSNYQQPRTSPADSSDYPSVQFPILRYPVIAELNPTAPASYTSSSAIQGFDPTQIPGHFVPQRHPRIRPAASATRPHRTSDVAADFAGPGHEPPSMPQASF